MSNKIRWLWLAMIFGAANASLWKVSDRYASLRDFCDAVSRGEPPELTDRQRESAAKISLSDAESLAEKYALKGINIVDYGSADYPERLRWIPNPPPVIFCRGKIGALSSSAVIAVVGTRNPCEYSLKVTREICGQLAEMGVTVISGFEQGIDSEANEAALARGGLTAAVCGRGISDSRTESELGKKISEQGILLSEFTDYQEFGRVNFANRNRILCGLADGVLFVECSAESRGLSNVKYALTLGRPIFAVPPADISDKRFFGQRDIIRTGAICVFHANDILHGLKQAGRASELLMLETEENINKKQSKKQQKNKTPTKNLKKVQKNSEEGLHKTQNSVTIDISSLNEPQRKICELLGEGEMHMNIIAEKLGLPVNVLINELTMLQLKNVIEELPGRQYRLR
jgi:DNA processing protein